MATSVVSAAFSVVGKALAPLTDGLLENWAASKKLGSNVMDLEKELMSVKILLEHIVGKEIENKSLKYSLEKLQDLAYDAEDVLDELDYFRIQDLLDGTFDAANEHAKGCAPNLALNVRHTAKSVVDKLICLPACLSASTPAPGGAPHTRQSNQEANGSNAKLTFRASCNPIHSVGKHLPCCSSMPYVDDDHDDTGDNSRINISPQRNHTDDEPLKLSFNRVDASKRMQDIVKELRSMREIISQAIATIGSGWSKTPDIAQSRPITTYESIEPKLYGRGPLMNSIIKDITQGKYSGNEGLTVIPILGPGGMGKTTLAQHIYCSEAVQNHFNVKVWTCVSLNFNVNKLIEKIENHIPEVDSERKGSAEDLIAQRLENRRFLLVLDDMWDCSDKEDEWKQLLLPFQKSKVQGNIIIVTTRIPAQADMVSTIDKPMNLEGLDHNEFKELFLHIVFGDGKSTKDYTYLLQIGDEIVDKLNGSPLAAKTVGRLLKKQLDLVHWTRILESKEWNKIEGNDDIMPALKLSYDYLPFHLKQCFSYCALFPQDYKFESEELINFWIGLDVLHSSNGENERYEDIGLSHLTELVHNHGLLEMERKDDGSICYSIHDLLHELARKVSSLECLSIDNFPSQVVSLHVVPSSVRHLSINIDDTSVNRRPTLINCLEDFSTSDKRLKVDKLRSLMIFGEHHGCFVKVFCHLFREAKALRVIFLSKASYGVEDLLHNFYHLIHLRYLRIVGSVLNGTRFPNKLSRFYHMIVLDARRCACIDDLPRDMSNLVKLRHFLVEHHHDAIHSSIVEVGKLKSLQELRRFMVKQEGKGFKLKEIGHLVHLGGSLCIDNLENVKVKEEADEAKLDKKGRLYELKLHWDNFGRTTNDLTLDEQVIEKLRPSSNLIKLSIKGHRGTTCPLWLGTKLSVKNLESLCLEDVAWKSFPPIGEFWLIDLPRQENISGNNIKERFGNLRNLKLCRLALVKKWVVHAPCELFPFLEVLIIKDCPQLVELSFEHFACCRQGKEVNISLFPKLENLEIRNCPQLLSFPPVPWNEAPCFINIEGTGSSCLHELVCEKQNNSGEYSLAIQGNNDTNDITFWKVLDFHNLTGLKKLEMGSCESLPLCYMQMLSSLRILSMSCSTNSFPFVEADNHVKYQFPVEELYITEWNASGMELTQLLTYFPKLSDLQLCELEKVTGLDVRGQHATETRRSSSSANDLEQQQDTRAEGDIIVASAEAERGLLLLPPQLQDLVIYACPELRLHSDPHDDTNQDGRTGGGGGLQGLTSLRRLDIVNCPELLSSYSSSSFSSSFPFPNSLEHLEIFSRVGVDTVLRISNLTSLTSLSLRKCGDLRGEGLFSLLAQDGRTRGVGGLQGLTSLRRLEIEDCPKLLSSYSSSSFSSSFPFPNSLEHLEIYGAVGMDTLVPISNLTSLTSLLLFGCEDLRGKGLLSLLAQGYLTTLSVKETPNFFIDSGPPRMHEQELPSRSSNLQELEIDDVDGFTAALIRHSLIFSTLTKLDISWDYKVESFTEEQEALLFVDSLEDITFRCCINLQSLPERLHRLPNLKRLRIRRCRAIQMLPKDVLPSSLEVLVIISCPKIQPLTKDCLPDSLQKLEIEDCPAILSLPEVDDLPSSLREIDVRGSGSAELESHCRKLINIIPVVRVDITQGNKDMELATHQFPLLLPP